MLKLVLIFFITLSALPNIAYCNEFDTQIEDTIEIMSRNTKECVDYFRYVRNSAGYINGKLTLPNLQLGDTVKLEFKTQYTPPLPQFKGILLPDESSDVILTKLRNKAAISYRIDFSFNAVLPELNHIYVNNNTVCTIELPREFNDKFILEHKLELINDTIPVYTNNIYIPNFMEAPTCGHVYTENANNEFETLVYGGKAIQRGEFPWLTAVYRKHKRGTNFVCGGSLLSSEIILTAAHCIREYGLRAEEIFVYLGRHKLNKYDEVGIVTRNIKSVIIHPEYNRDVHFPDADLAMLKMVEPVSFTKFIQPICLWNAPANESLIVNEIGVVAGWGSNENGNSISVVPKKVEVDIVSEVKCIRSAVGLVELTTSRTLCAGKRDGTGPCTGDSGGGLIIRHNGIWMLRGVVSSGLVYQDRCDLQEYTVYCDIAKHKSWFDDQIGNLEPSFTGPVDDICGISESTSEPHKGYEWLAAVYIRDLPGEIFFCTGILISARSVLVPAHYLIFNNKTVLSDMLRVYLGRYNLSDIQQSNVERRDVDAVIVHPYYNINGNRRYGVAILQLKTAIRFTRYIKPICLPNQYDFLASVIGQAVTLLSWNKLKVYNETLSVPQSIVANIQKIDECLKPSGNESFSSLEPYFLCTAVTSDAILVLKDAGRFVVRGISSFVDYVGLYTDVLEYLLWIKSVALL